MPIYARDNWGIIFIFDEHNFVILDGIEHFCNFIQNLLILSHSKIKLKKFPRAFYIKLLFNSFYDLQFN